jgi:protein SCO1/2
MMKKRIYVSQVVKEGLAPAWHFLTGSDDSIHAATDAAGFRYYYDKKADQYIHVTGMMVLTPDGRVSKYFYGMEYSSNDLRLALDDAAQSKVGSLATAFLLYCYHYDPATGKYDLAVTNILRLGGGITVMGLLGFIGLQFVRDRGRRAGGGLNVSPEEQSSAR